MPVYVITGVTRGIGFEFLKQISAKPANIVVGLVRDQAGTEKKVSAELGDRSNVHILSADLTEYKTLQKAVADVEALGITSVDYVVANGGLVPYLDQYGPIGDLSAKPDQVDAVSSDLLKTNVLGNMHLFELFLPLVRKGSAKKVIAISTGMADLDFINNYDVETGALYSASKAALNIIVAKFSAQYKKEGILFMSVSPGLVDTGHFADATEEELAGMKDLGAQLKAYAPHFTGPITPEESVKHIIATWEKASIEGQFGGAFISHLGNKQWV